MCGEALGYMDKPYKIIKANSGAIRFSISSRSDRRPSFFFHLLKKDCPHKTAYTIGLGNKGTLHDIRINEVVSFIIPNFNNQSVHDFWLTWFNDVIRFGKYYEPALVTYSEVNVESKKELIGFIKFDTCIKHNREVQWEVESLPIMYIPTTVSKKVDGGALRWVRMDKDSPLPIDALIGGLEDEPLYIARASHRGSLCPGKYIKSKKLAFIPWGHEEIAKDEFEILCGYDAMWVNCSSNHIPENAFVGGYSEVRREPLLIGRAWLHNNLVVGKVHLLYKTCYLPYRENEVETSKYETLVIASKASRAETPFSPCYMRMLKQQCL